MKKKYLVISLVIMICNLISKIVLAQENSNTTRNTIEYLVTGDIANLRSGPGTTFANVGRVVKGESVLIYDEEAEVSGWLKVYRPGEDDAFIADFLVERAPIRFYPVDQEPMFEVSGQGKFVTDVYDIPNGAFRFDAIVQDRSFILQAIVVEGDCKDTTIFNELDFDKRSLTISGLFVSSGCSIIFETDNVDGAWEFAVRDIIVDGEFLLKNTLVIENGTVVSGSGRALTMPTMLAEGIWTINAKVDDNAFILKPQVLSGDCDNFAALNEFDSNANTLDLSTIYRSSENGCVIFWETSNVEGNWEITFEKVR